MKLLNRKALLTALILVTLTAFNAFAVDPTIGLELNFINHAIERAWRAQANPNEVNNDQSELFRDRLKEAVEASCGNCKITKYKNPYGVLSYRIKYPDGWFFQISTDPGVVELQTAPITVDKLRDSVGERIERDIFANARALGLRADTNGSKPASGHIHFGLTSSFEGDLELFRNFVVDYVNHPELASGIFTNDNHNAPPVSKLSEQQQNAFIKLIADYDAGKIKSFNTFAKRLRRDVYHTTFGDISPPEKYQALNVNRIGPPNETGFDLDEQTMEVRSFTAQATVDEIYHQANLIKQRLLYLKKKNRRVPVNIPSAIMSRQERVEAFYHYVVETGLSFEPYHQYVPEFDQMYIHPVRRAYEEKKAKCVNVLM